MADSRTQHSTPNTAKPYGPFVQGLNLLFRPYMQENSAIWDCSFFDTLWAIFPSRQCDCCEGHLFLHCGHRCHLGFEVHGRACHGCAHDRIHSLLRYETKMGVAGRRVLIASEFDKHGFVCYLVLTENSEELRTFHSHSALVAALPGADVDVYQRRGDVYDDHN